MDDQLYIPAKIKVGFQTREDTYSKKLAYVIYYDSKGKLRKEVSWEGWRDKKIEAQDLDNSPMEGFVLNKKVGGYKSDWNHRATYTRVFDPRGFEFEISVPNLLYILQETDCTKGKGLIGEFVYAWSGKDLILLPVDCEEYRKSTGYTELQGQKVSARALIAGATYETKQQEKLIYLGKYMWYDTKSSYSWENEKPIRAGRKKFVFVNDSGKMVDLLSISSLAKCASDTPVDNYADLLDKFRGMAESSKIVKLSFGKETGFKLTKPTDSYYKDHCKYNDKQINYYVYDERNEEYAKYHVSINDNYNYGCGKDRPVSFNITKEGQRFVFKDGELFAKIAKVKDTSRYWRTELINEPAARIKESVPLEEFEKMTFPQLYVTLEDGLTTLFKDKIKL